MAEIMLNGSRVLAVIRQLVTAGMSQHVAVDNTYLLHLFCSRVI
jgi:hypothetical protein